MDSFAPEMTVESFCTLDRVRLGEPVKRITDRGGPLQVETLDGNVYAVSLPLNTLDKATVKPRIRAPP